MLTPSRTLWRRTSFVGLRHRSASHESLRTTLGTAALWALIFSAHNRQAGGIERLRVE